MNLFGHRDPYADEADAAAQSAAPPPPSPGAVPTSNNEPLRVKIRPRHRDPYAEEEAVTNESVKDDPKFKAFIADSNNNSLWGGFVPRVPVEGRDEPPVAPLSEEETFSRQVNAFNASQEFDKREIEEHGRLLTDIERRNIEYLNTTDYSKQATQDINDQLEFIERGAIEAGVDEGEFFDANVLPNIKENTPTLGAILDYTGVTGFKLMQKALRGVMWTGGTYADGVKNFMTNLDKTVGLEWTPHKTIEGNVRAFLRDSYAGLTLSDAAGVSGYGRRLVTGAARELKREAQAAKTFEQTRQLIETGQRSTIGSRLKAKVTGQPEEFVPAPLTRSSLEGATSEQVALRAAEAKKVATENTDIAEQLLKDFETATGRKISKERTILPETEMVDGKKVAKGTPKRKLVYDPDAARQAGMDVTEEIAEIERKLADAKRRSGGMLTGKTSEVRELEKQLVEIRENKALFGVEDRLTSPILNPEKFDAIVAVASDLKTKFPDAFDNNQTLIDNLFDLTVKGDLTGDNASELMNVLGSYGLSFDDYVLTVVSGGSQAGKILNKLSQLRRAKPGNEADNAAIKASVEAQKNIHNLFMRIENVRRGGLVSQLKTAIRNLTSAYMRSPLEALQSVMDTALLNMSEEGAVSGAKSLVSWTNWKDSFRSLKYMYGDTETAKTYSDFILSRPQLAGQMDLMYNNINEIQMMTGRGTGTKTDKVLSEMEDLTMALNIPNRWQEMVVRRGMFLGELQRLTRREYGIDLMENINQGKIIDLLNDAPGIRPEGSKPFIELIADSTQRALDVTYAKQPDVKAFKRAATFITRSGMTVVAPFPRFMFNAMELIGQYAGGASIPLTQMVNRQIRKGMGKEVTKEGVLASAKNRQRIGRNLTGFAALVGAYTYRTSEDAPADYKEVRTNEGTVMDTTPQFPMRQLLFLGEAAKQGMKLGWGAAFNEWFMRKDMLQEFADTFIQPVRTGVGASVVQEAFDFMGLGFGESKDLVKNEKRARTAGKLLGNYLRTWVVPLQQIMDVERGLGKRTTEYKDVAKDPVFDMGRTFKQELGRTFEQSGFISPEEEAELPRRSGIFTREGAERISPFSTFALGINLKTESTEAGEYLKNFGFQEWKEGSRSRVPSIRRFENNFIRQYIPMVAEATRVKEDYYREVWDNNSALQEEYPKVELYIYQNIRPEVKDDLALLKSALASGEILPEKAAAAIAADIGIEKWNELDEEDKRQRVGYTTSVINFRKLPPDTRKRALSRYIQERGVPADVSNYIDLIYLVDIGRKLERGAY